MGHYIGMRFSAPLNDEGRRLVECVLEPASAGDWLAASRMFTKPALDRFARMDRAKAIPIGFPQGMPTEWEGWSNLSDPDCYVWQGACALKNGARDTLYFFLEKVLPMFLSRPAFVEIYDEEWGTMEPCRDVIQPGESYKLQLV